MFWCRCCRVKVNEIRRKTGFTKKSLSHGENIKISHFCLFQKVGHWFFVSHECSDSCWLVVKICRQVTRQVMQAAGPCRDPLLKSSPHHARRPHHDLAWPRRRTKTSPRVILQLICSVFAGGMSLLRVPTTADDQERVVGLPHNAFPQLYRFSVRVSSAWCVF